MQVETEAWPALPLEAWKDTRDTLHMWTQIIGKIRLKLAPHLNHWWQVPLYLTSRGLTTTPIPFGDREFDVTFDFIDHTLIIQTSDGRSEQIPLRPRSVADFYHELMASLHRLAIDVKISTIFYGVLPFILTDIIRLIILIAFPIIALWLPSRM